VLRRALAKDPRQRYGSAREMAEALARARSPSARQQPVGTDALQAPTVVSTRAAPPTARAWTASRLAPWLLVLPVAVGAAALWRYGGTPAPPAPSTLSAAAEPPLPSAEPPVAPPGSVAPPGTTAAAEGLPPPATPAPIPRRTPAAVPSPDRTRPTVAPARVPASLVPAAAATAPPPTTTPAPETVAPAPGLLQIAVVPWGEVSVDGRLVGTTPLDRLTLPAGPHVIRVRNPRLGTQERTVVIRPGQLERIKVDLTAGPSPPA
jgi:serine/threonine-protein kinase